jgi:SMI1-KNR4 cell-wall
MNDLSEKTQLILALETQIGHSLPDDYKTFLIHFDKLSLKGRYFYRILDDGDKIASQIDHFFTIHTFLKGNEFRDYLVEFQTHFDVQTDVVEAECLYHIAFGYPNLCIAIGGQHHGKIYNVDNGDFGIHFQANHLNEFLESLYAETEMD